MKDNWIEMLFNLVTNGLSKLKESQETSKEQEVNIDLDQIEYSFELSPTATRVLSSDERSKLQSESWQFLLNMQTAGVLGDQDFESVMNTLIFSESAEIDLDETKWAIRKTLYSQLSPEELRFLDLILYHKEQEVPLH